MLGQAREVEEGQSGFVEFVTTGAPAAGAFHCSSCGYGVTVQATLPQCPMCNGTTWERETSRPSETRT